ncbi:hypothetical protein FocnCong_v020133 [Fusarium oxysporum f. sp. conglutinans]|nr:hypothetical protein FocnCong_v020133 [Fusarium oxysporum f. sp. conglutinans]
MGGCLTFKGLDPSLLIDSAQTPRLAANSTSYTQFNSSVSAVSYPQHDQQLTTYGQPPLQHLQQPMYYLLQNQHQSTPPHALNSLYFQGDPCSGHLIAPQTTTVSPEAGPQQPVSQHKHHLCRETAVDILPIFVTTPLSKFLSPELFPMQQARHPQDGERLKSPGNSTPDINPSMTHGLMPAASLLAVLRGDNSVPWVTFQHPRERGQEQYTICCDIKSVNSDELSPEFKQENCIYPRTCCPKSQYKGNRWVYETNCNRVGWALAKLNPDLQGRRGLIQQAVNSWHNSNVNPKLRSRKARRIAKETEDQPCLAPSP